MILHHVAHLAGHVVPQLVGVVDAVCALSSDLEHAVLDAAVAALHAVDLVHQLGLGLAHDLEDHVGHVAVLGHIGHLGAHLKGLVACSGEHGSGVVVDVDALHQGLDGGLHERGILAVVGIVFHNLGERLGHLGQHELVGQCHGRVDIGVHVHTLRAQGLDGEFHAVGRVAHVHIDHGASLALGLLGGEVGLGSEVAGHVHIGLALGALGIANAEPAGHALAGVGLGHAPPQVGVAQVGSVAVLDAKGVDAGGRGHVGAQVVGVALFDLVDVVEHHALELAVGGVACLVEVDLHLVDEPLPHAVVVGNDGAAGLAVHVLHDDRLDVGRNGGEGGVGIEGAVLVGHEPYLHVGVGLDEVLKVVGGLLLVFVARRLEVGQHYLLAQLDGVGDIVVALDVVAVVVGAGQAVELVAAVGQLAVDAHVHRSGLGLVDIGGCIVLALDVDPLAGGHVLNLVEAALDGSVGLHLVEAPLDALVGAAVVVGVDIAEAVLCTVVVGAQVVGVALLDAVDGLEHIGLDVAVGLRRAQVLLHIVDQEVPGGIGGFLLDAAVVVHGLDHLVGDDGDGGQGIHIVGTGHGLDAHVDVVVHELVEVVLCLLHVLVAGLAGGVAFTVGVVALEDGGDGNLAQAQGLVDVAVALHELAGGGVGAGQAVELVAAVGQLAGKAQVHVAGLGLGGIGASVVLAAYFYILVVAHVVDLVGAAGQVLGLHLLCNHAPHEALAREVGLGGVDIAEAVLGTVVVGGEIVGVVLLNLVDVVEHHLLELAVGAGLVEIALHIVYAKLPGGLGGGLGNGAVGLHLVGHFLRHGGNGGKGIHGLVLPGHGLDAHVHVLVQVFLKIGLCLDNVVGTGLAHALVVAVEHGGDGILAQGDGAVDVAVAVYIGVALFLDGSELGELDRAVVAALAKGQVDVAGVGLEGVGLGIVLLEHLNIVLVAQVAHLVGAVLQCVGTHLGDELPLEVVVGLTRAGDGCKVGIGLHVVKRRVAVGAQQVGLAQGHLAQVAQHLGLEVGIGLALAQVLLHERAQVGIGGRLRGFGNFAFLHHPVEHLVGQVGNGGHGTVGAGLASHGVEAHVGVVGDKLVHGLLGLGLVFIARRGNLLPEHSVANVDGSGNVVVDFNTLGLPVGSGVGRSQRVHLVGAVVEHASHTHGDLAGFGLGALVGLGGILAGHLHIELGPYILNAIDARLGRLRMGAKPAHSEQQRHNHVA